MSYTDADLERAREFVAGHSSIPGVKAVGQLIADVRNETIERCAVVFDEFAKDGEGDISPCAAAATIRALKAGAK